MKYTVITGASSGIGYQAAIELAKIGKNLVVVARREDELKKLKEEIAGINKDVDVMIKVCDLSSSDNAKKLYESLKAIEIETFVNNAGFGDGKNVGDANLEKIEKIINVNITALTVLSNLFVRDYKDVADTNLINVSSFIGYHVLPTMATYSASKFYVSAFTEALDAELKAGNHKLQAKVLAPALTETEFSKWSYDMAENYDYSSGGDRYNTANEMAKFMVRLIDGNKTVGIVDTNTYDISLEDSKFIVL